MAITFHRVTVPVLVRGLRILRTYLDHAEAFANEGNRSVEQLLEARLAPDMMTFAGQIQRASDAAKSGMARVSGTKAPSFPDVEKTIDELRERLDKTIGFVESFGPQQVDGNEDVLTDVKQPGGKEKTRAEDYILQITLPNFFFHVTTAHDILRNQGVKIGKRDYLGQFS